MTAPPIWCRAVIFVILYVYIHRFAEGERIDTNSVGVSSEKLFYRGGVVFKLFGVSFCKLFYCQRLVRNFIGSQLIGLIIAEDKISVRVLKHDVDNSLYHKRFVCDILLELFRLCEFRRGQEKIEALLTKHSFCAL